MEEYGSQINLEYETQNHDGVNMKTGTISGTMVCSESQYQSIPYRGHIHGRLVLVTVMGRQTVCLRCGDMGHQRSTCPLKPAKKSYAAATRGDTQGEWQTVGSSRLTPTTTNQVETEEPEETQHVPLSPESEVGVKMGPPQMGKWRRANGPPQDMRGTGQESTDNLRPPARQAQEWGHFG